MKSITKLNDLERYGIVPLTGESCCLMYRVLFDVTERGKRTLETCFRVRGLELEDPSTPGTRQEPHVGSIMLAPCTLPSIGIFALLEAGCPEVWQKGDSLYGVEAADDPEWLSAFKKQHGPLRRFVDHRNGTDRPNN